MIYSDLYYFAYFSEYKFADFAWKFNSLQFSNENILQSAQQIKKIDLDYHVVIDRWFRVAYIILCNLQNTNLQILLTKTPPGNPINDY